MANPFNQLLYTDNLAEGTDKLNANFAMLQNAPTEGMGIPSVALLPTLPDLAYPENSIVMLTTDNKLYKNVGGLWTPVVNTADLEGQISGGQIEDGALDIAKFAANLKPPIIVGTLPALPDANYPVDTLVLFDGMLYQNISESWEALSSDFELPDGSVIPRVVSSLPVLPDVEFPIGALVVYNSILYRNDAGTWTNVVNAGDLTGQISGVQISDDAITAEKIAANTITASEIAANTITADQLAANTITAAQIAAGTIGADEIAANSITADHLTTNSVTAGAIQAGAVGASEIAANSITASKLRIGSTNNILQNSEWIDGVIAPWTVWGGSVIQPVSGSVPYSSRVTADGVSWPGLSSQRFKVTPGESYYAQAQVSTIGGGFEILLVGYNESGAQVQWGTVWSASGNTSWQTVNNIITVNSGVVEMAFIFQANPSATSGNQGFMNSAKVYRAGEGRLIVDGAITASKVAADAIEAHHILAGEIGTDHLAADAVTAGKIDANAIEAEHISTGAIESEHISAGAITASKLSIIDTSNMVLNSGFDQDGYSLEGWSSPIEVGGTSGQPQIGNFARLTITTGNRDVYNGAGWFNVEPGEVFYVSFWAYRSSASGNFRVGLAFRQPDGSSTTWVPAATALSSAANTNWIKYEGYVTAPSGSRTQARVWTSTVGNALPAGYWLFANVIVRRATDSRLLVDGEIQITNADKNNGALSVRNSGNTEVLRLGNITGKAGVPSGTQFGLWGALGTGVHIQGAPKVVSAGYLKFTPSLTVNANSTGIIDTNQIIQPAAFTVPAGKRWLVLATPSLVSVPNNNAVVLQSFGARGRAAFGSTLYDGIVPANSYPANALRIYYTARYRNLTGTNWTGVVSIDIMYTILEVDA